MERQIQADTAKCWYVRTQENAVYGPATFDELIAWAAEARIVPGCVISRDRKQWEPADNLPELRMEWWVELTAGGQIGPLHLYAICDLVREGSVANGAALANPKRKITTRVGNDLVALIADEARRDLTAHVKFGSAVQSAAGPAVNDGHAVTVPNPELVRINDALAAAERGHAAKVAELEQAVVVRQARIHDLETERAAADVARIAFEEQLKAMTQTVAVRTERLVQVENEARKGVEELRVRDEQLQNALAELEVSRRTITEMGKRDEQTRVVFQQFDESRQKVADLTIEVDGLRQAQLQRESKWNEQRDAYEVTITATRKSTAEFQARLATEAKNHDAEVKKQRQELAGLQAEIVRLQKEATVTASVLTRTTNELELSNRKRGKKAIDWMEPAKRTDISPGTTGEVPDTMRTEMALRNELQTVTVMFARVEKELAKQHELYNALKKEADAREAELNVLVDQLKSDIQASTVVVRQTMQEIERREIDYRNLRRQGEKRETELLERIAALEMPGGRAIHDAGGGVPVIPEILPPLQPQVTEPSATNAAEPADILAGLEARAHVELEAWRRKESNVQNDRPKGKLTNWLRRKQQ